MHFWLVVFFFIECFSNNVLLYEIVWFTSPLKSSCHIYWIHLNYILIIFIVNVCISDNSLILFSIIIWILFSRIRSISAIFLVMGICSHEKSVLILVFRMFDRVLQRPFFGIWFDPTHKRIWTYMNPAYFLFKWHGLIQRLFVVV